MRWLKAKDADDTKSENATMISMNLMFELAQVKH